MSTQPKHLLTPEEYLEIERKAEYKSEYYQGEMFAMSGGVSSHNLICVDVVFLLSGQLRSRNCYVYNSDMRVLVNPAGLYTYPDLSIVCGERRFLDGREDTLLNPNVIVEVLSPSTEAYDRGRKLKMYSGIESLTAYLLLASDRVEADLFTRQPGGEWSVTLTDRPEDTLELPSIGCRLKIADVYLKSGLVPQTSG
jgi:Uma2 family endonuclease